MSDTEVDLQSVQVPRDDATYEPSDRDASVATAAAQPEPAAVPLAPADPAEPAYIYAIGRIEPRFPSLSLEKEFAQAGARITTEGLSDRQAFRAVVQEPSHRYLARQICWLLLVGDLETYVLVPRDPADYALLIEAYREYATGDDLDVVIGMRGPIAPPEMCNGLALPIVVFDQLYSFHRDALLDAIPRPAGLNQKATQAFGRTSTDVFEELRRVADNAGATDEHRALNYLSVRYPAIYGKAAELQAGDAWLSGIDVRPSAISSARRVVDVIFSFTNRQTDVVEAYFVRVDVTEEYPFLVTKLSRYFLTIGP